jgi:hypothetical protein
VKAGAIVRSSFGIALDSCAACGDTARISPRLSGEERKWALRDQGWLSLAAEKTDGPPLPRERLLLCPHCLVAPPPKAAELLVARGIPPDAFVKLKPPAPKPQRERAARRKSTLVRKCASCGRWLEASPDWTVRVGAKLRSAGTKLRPKELLVALWYCGSPGCRAQAKRRAARHREARE